jgi:hypothetical protein
MHSPGFLSPRCTIRTSNWSRQEAKSKLSSDPGLRLRESFLEVRAQSSTTPVAIGESWEKAVCFPGKELDVVILSLPRGGSSLPCSQLGPQPVESVRRCPGSFRIRGSRPRSSSTCTESALQLLFCFFSTIFPSDGCEPLAAPPSWWRGLALAGNLESQEMLTLEADAVPREKASAPPLSSPVSTKSPSSANLSCQHLDA